MADTIRRALHHCACAQCQHEPHSATAKLHAAINRVIAALDEKSRRRFAGLWAAQLGWGGIQRMRTISGLSRPTIARGRQEVERRGGQAPRRIRRRGAGRPRVEKNGPASWPRWMRSCARPPRAIRWGS